MDRRTYLALAGAAAGALTGCAGSRSGGETAGTTAAGEPYRVETVATGFDHPWAVAHLPGTTRLLVTERVGRLSVVDRADGRVGAVDGTPDVYARGQGGLLDVAVDPRYPDPPWVYLTYAVAGLDGTSTTRIGRGRLDPGATELSDVEVLYTAEPFVESTGHFGSRVGFGPDGHLFATVGDRQFKNFGPDHVAQDPGNDLGTTLRLRPDGTVPDDNPFVDRADARDAVFSYGHRNAQGLAVHPETGDVWESEFGERDGDEINLIRSGGNYGWPVADEGCTYDSGEPIGVSHADRPGVVSPAYTWECGSGGFPPSGAAFYDGDTFPEWRGDLLVGGLASQYMARIRVEGDGATPAGELLADRGWRIRDVAVGPDSGHVYVAVDAGDAPLVRLRP